MTQEPQTPNQRQHPRLRKTLRVLALLLLGLTLTLLTLWATLAVCLSDLSGSSPRYVLATITLVAALASVLFIRPPRYGVLGVLLIFGIVLAWFLSLSPSNDRHWAPEVSVLPWAEIGPDHVIVHNIRNCDYRSETDFTPAWYNRSLDLNQITTVDFSLCYWGSKAIAHAIVSFGFEDGQYLAVSIETRKEKWESYSAIQGFFRQYELIYVFADERDALRLRTNYRKEDVYLYRTRFSPQEAKAIFLSYVEEANILRQHPKWYNALTTNCVSSVIPHARAANPSARMSWQVVLSGYAARQAYRNGNLDNSMPFEQLESRSRINAAAMAADTDPEFSARIRASLPMPATRRSR